MKIQLKNLIPCFLILYLYGGRTENVVTPLSNGHDVFHEFLHAVVADDAEREYFLLEDIDKIVSTIQQRFPQHAKLQKVNATNINEGLNLVLNSNDEINEEVFGDIAKYIIKIVSPSDVAETANVSKQKLADILHHIETLNYQESHDDQCFNQNTIISEGSKVDYQTVYTGLLYYLYKGLCIYPSVDDLTNSLKEALGLHGDEDQISKEEFKKLLVNLNIDGAEEDHVEEDHEDQDHHDHSRRKRSEDHEEHEHEESVCLQADGFYAVFDVKENISWNQFTEISTVIIQQMYTGSCSTKALSENATDEPTAYTTSMKYGYGTAAVLIISALALVGFLIFPLIGRSAYEGVMQFFVALGVSALLSDAILHMIPFIVGIHIHDDSADHALEEEEESFDYVWKLSVTLLGIWCFFLFECGLRFWHAWRSAGNISDHPHNHHVMADGNCVTLENVRATTDLSTNGHTVSGEIEKKDGARISIDKTDEVSEIVVTGDGSGSDIVCFGLSPVCLMIFVGDVLHNFGDGIAIGVAFSISLSTGIGTSLAIFCHELPHEFGDFALYLSHGASKIKAISLNAIAALCALGGLYLGLGVAQDTAVRQWMLAVIAGMFIYISLVDVMHEIIQNVAKKPKYIFLIQNIGLILGWVLLLLIALYEDDLEGVAQ